MPFANPQARNEYMREYRRRKSRQRTQTASCPRVVSASRAVGPDRIKDSGTSNVFSESSASRAVVLFPGGFRRFVPPRIIGPGAINWDTTYKVAVMRAYSGQGQREITRAERFEVRLLPRRFTVVAGLIVLGFGIWWLSSKGLRSGATTGLTVAGAREWVHWMPGVAL
jgi:hypothetical protein